MTTTKNYKQLLLFLEWYDTEIYQGVSEYCREHDLSLNQNYCTRKVIPTHAKYDGIICGFTSHASSHNAFLLNQNIPMINIDLIRKGKDIPQVLTDDYRIGALQAQHLLLCEYKRFIYSIWREDSHPKRYEGFQNTIEKAGFKSELLIDPVSLGENRIIDIVNSNDSPLGLALNDMEAMFFMEIFGKHGIKVPERVGVIGVDNRLDICDFTPQAKLTSVDTNLFQLGYQAAAMLCKMIYGNKPAQNVTMIPPKGIVKRGSTKMLKNENIALALKITQTQYDTPIKAQELVRYAKCSWPTLRKAFKASTGYSISDYITHLRIEKAKKLILETDLKIYEIAESCGYQGTKQFTRAFLRETGMNSTEYKARHLK